MDKFPEVKTNFNHYSAPSTKLILSNFGQNTDGFEILVYPVFYRLSTKKENGLP
jgi:hypothetical protein